MFTKPDENLYGELYRWRSDEFAKKYNPFVPCDLDKFTEILNSFTTDFNELYSGKAFKWCVKENNKLLALIGIDEINAMMKTAEIGYQVSPEHRGQGIGTRVVKDFVHMIFQETDLRKLIATVAVGNIPSCKILEKAGFKREGLLHKHFLINGKETDQVIYGLLREGSVNGSTL